MIRAAIGVWLAVVVVAFAYELLDKRRCTQPRTRAVRLTLWGD